MTSTDLPTFSVVVPVHNEAGTLEQLYTRLKDVMEGLEESFEVILVDDGSFDGSAEVIKSIRSGDSRVKLVSFSRNFGHQAAITAGLDVASGQATVVMDSDLQHPPEVIPLLVARWREGFEIVNAVRSDRRGETAFKRVTARGFYWLLCRLSHIEMSPNVGDFRLIDRKALEAFRSMRESTRYLRGMFSWVGFRQTAIPYDYHDRHAGEPKYNFSRMLTLAVNGLVSFSNAPLELALHIGFTVSALSFLAGIVDIIAKITWANTVPGWLSTVITVSFLGGMQLFILGVMGIYMSRMYEEVKQRPLYVVRETEGVERVPANLEKAHIADLDPV